MTLLRRHITLEIDKCLEAGSQLKGYRKAKCRARKETLEEVLKFLDHTATRHGGSSGPQPY